MSITDRTRKALWAKSGNRCSMCQRELVQEIDGETDALIIGEECHIVSAKRKGPRGEIEFSGDFDGYDNLILLCANDHKKIDELTDYYTVEKLRSLKVAHENWVKATLEKDATAFTNDQRNIKSLPKIVTGTQLVGIVSGSDAYHFEHDELNTEDEATEIGGLFDELKDYGEVLPDLGFAEVAQWGLHLNSKMEALRNMGFVLFGMKRKLRLRNNSNKDMGFLDTATIIAVRQDNPSIVGDFLIARFPKKVNLSS